MIEESEEEETNTKTQPAKATTQTSSVESLPPLSPGPPTSSSFLSTKKNGSPTHSTPSTLPVNVSSDVAPIESARPASQPISTHGVVDAELQETFNHIYAQVKSLTQDESTSPSTSHHSPPSLTAVSLRSTFDALLDAYYASQYSSHSNNLRAAHSSRELESFQSFLSQHLLPSVSQKSAHLRSTFMDPTIASILSQSNAKQLELERALIDREHKTMADQFKADSITGRKLLSRVQRLAEENLEWEVTLHNKTAASVKRCRQLESALAEERLKNSQLHTMLNDQTEFLNELEIDHQRLSEKMRIVQKKLEQQQSHPQSHPQSQLIKIEVDSNTHPTTATSTNVDNMAH